MSTQRWFLLAFLVFGLIGPSIAQDGKEKEKTKTEKKTEKKTKDKKGDDKEKKTKDKDKTKDKGGPVELKWQFKKDEVFYQEMTTDTKQTMKVMGMDITQNQKQTFYFKWTVKEGEKGKDWTVEQEIIGAKMDINIGGAPIQFDSQKEGPANPLTDFFKKLIGSKFTLTITPDFKITKIAGRDEFLKKLISQNPQMQKLLTEILSEDALKQMAEPAFAMLPDKAVKKDDTWDRESKLNMGPIGTYDTKYTYTYEGMEDKLAKIGVKTSLKYTPPQGGGAQIPFVIKKADLKTTEGSGTVLFNNTEGRLASSEITVKLEGTLQIEVTGMDATVELSQTQTTSVKTSSDNPLGGATKKKE